MEFSYSDSTEIITFFNTKATQINVLGNCAQFVYKINSLGFRESLYFEDRTGKKIENSWNIYEYNWIYNQDGSVIEERFNKEGKLAPIRPGFEFNRLKLFFNVHGHIALMQNIDNTGKLIENSSGAAQDMITTNSNGNFLQWQVLNKNGDLEKGNSPDVAIGIQRFNEYGYEVRLEHRDEYNQLIYNSYGICISKTKFDDWGNLSERIFYDPFEKPALHKKAGYNKLKLYWDATGNHRIKLEYYDVQGNPTAHKERGFHKVKYDYNANNNLVMMSYYDISNELVNRKDNGIASISYEYDNNGKLSGSFRYTKDGKLYKD